MELLQPREEVAPERQRSSDEVLPHPALRLVHAERDAAGERGALERRVDLALVEPMAELVHRPEEAAEMLAEVARRDADVGHAGSGRERVHGRIEPPRLVVEAEGTRDFELEELLCVEVEIVIRCSAASARGDLLHERRLMLLQVVEQPADVFRLHAALVVVEHDVVRLVADFEAVDVLLAQVEVLAEHRQEES